MQMNPRYDRAHNLYGKILLRLGQYNEARGHLEAVLKYEKEEKIARSAKKLLIRLQITTKNNDDTNIAR